MDMWSWSMLQLLFVTVVYCFAYRTGYKAAKSHAASTVKAVTGGVSELLDSLNETLDQAIEAQKKNRQDKES